MSFNKRLADNATAADDSQFKVLLYTGNRNAASTNSQSITGVGFEPGLIIAKVREFASTPSTTYGFVLANQVRGTQKFIDTSNGNNENTNPKSVTSFDADGFTVGAYGNWNGGLPGNNLAMVSYNFKQGTDFSNNTDGDITSSGNTNAELGLSIVNWTGSGSGTATVGHNMNGAPEMIIMKNLSSSSTNWRVYSTANAAGKSNSLGAGASHEGEYDFGWSVNSTTFSSTPSITNGQTSGGQSIIAFCFKSVAGQTAVGAYDGSSSDVTINLGFKPSFVLIKNVKKTSQYVVFDDQREGVLFFNDASAELNGINSSHANNQGSIGGMPIQSGAPPDEFIQFTATGMVIKQNDTVQVLQSGSSNRYSYLAIK